MRLLVSVFVVLTLTVILWLRSTGNDYSSSTPRVIPSEAISDKPFEGELADADSEKTIKTPRLPVLDPQPETGKGNVVSDNPPRFEPSAQPEQEYDLMPLPQLEGIQAQLNSQIGELSTPLYKQLRDAGRYEVIGEIAPGASVTLPDAGDMRVLSSIESDRTTGLITKTVIPEEEYPDLYKLVDQYLAVSREIAERRGQ
jgi:hypothetical protein